MRSLASILFHQQSLTTDLIPKHVNVKIAQTSPAVKKKKEREREVNKHN
jgi:hypothetical protein